jgi:hypothetical protein
MSLRRWVAAFFALVVLSISVPTWGEGWAWLPFAAGSQQVASADTSGVQKDDSQLTVVDARADGAAPIVETATKKKKSSSFWSSKIFHPTQWFGSSKKK